MYVWGQRTIAITAIVILWAARLWQYLTVKNHSCNVNDSLDVALTLTV